MVTKSVAAAAAAAASAASNSVDFCMLYLLMLVEDWMYSILQILLRLRHALLRAPTSTHLCLDPRALWSWGISALEPNSSCFHT